MKLNGEPHCLWRAVDHEGEVLEAVVTKRRGKAAALKLLRKLLKRHGSPEAIMTDKLRSHGAALTGLGLSICHGQRVVGSTIGLRTVTSRCEGGRGQCFRFQRCEVCTSSLPSILRPTITHLDKPEGRLQS